MRRDYSAWTLFKRGLAHQEGWKPAWRDAAPKREYDAVIIGEVVVDPHAFVRMETMFGGMRMVDWLAGEQLPRIC